MTWTDVRGKVANSPEPTLATAMGQIAMMESSGRFPPREVTIDDQSIVLIWRSGRRRTTATISGSVTSWHTEPRYYPD